MKSITTQTNNGKNNGDLSITIAELKKIGELNSSATLTKAFDELWSHGFIVLTREGCFSSTRTCNLWGLTTWPIHENDEKGIKGTKKESNDWMNWTPDCFAPDYRLKFPNVKAKRQRQSPTLKQAA